MHCYVLSNLFNIIANDVMMPWKPVSFLKTFQTKVSQVLTALWNSPQWRKLMHDEGKTTTDLLNRFEPYPDSLDNFPHIMSDIVLSKYGYFGTKLILRFKKFTNTSLSVVPVILKTRATHYLLKGGCFFKRSVKSIKVFYLQHVLIVANHRHFCWVHEYNGQSKVLKLVRAASTQ